MTRERVESSQGQIYFHRGSFPLASKEISFRVRPIEIEIDILFLSLSLSLSHGLIRNYDETVSTWLSVSACQAALGWVHTLSVEVSPG